MDVVIPAAPKDKEILDLCIQGARENVKEVDRVIAIAPEKVEGPDLCILDEALPVSKKDVAEVIGKNWRNGWYLQQLIKLYAAEAIPDLSERYLVIDADTVFLNPVEFTDPEGRALFGVATEFHRPYFEHMARLHPSLSRQFPQISGVGHHMVFDRPIIREIFELVETKHDIPFWNTFLCCIAPDQDLKSGASEYEIYFNYVFANHADKVALRPLKWRNVGTKEIEPFREKGFHYVSIHNFTLKARKRREAAQSNSKPAGKPKQKPQLPVRNGVAFIFVHIDKTAGSSIWKSLVPESGTIESENSNVQRAMKHATAEQLRNAVGSREFDEAFSFAIVRNPFDRIVSKYLFSRFVKQEPFADPFNRLAKQLNFDQWIRHLADRNHAPLKTQSEFILGADGNPLVEFIGRFEKLDQTWDVIRKRLSLPRDLRLEKVNTSPPRLHYSRYYRGESRKIVEAWYADDLRNFDYAFEEAGPAEQSESDSGLTFVFIVGIEGAGHHMIRAAFADLLKSPQWIDEGKWHPILIDYWSCKSAPTAADVEASFKDIFTHYRQKGVTHLFECASFPFFQPRNSIRRPDLVDTLETIERHAAIKFLVLDRDPAAATFSAIRRRFTDNLHYQARIVEDNLVTIASQLDQIDEQKYRVVRFDDMVSAPEQHARALAAWLNCSEDDLLSAASNLRKPKGLENAPIEDRAFLEEFFTERRRGQWEPAFSGPALV